MQRPFRLRKAYGATGRLGVAMLRKRWNNRTLTEFQRRFFESVRVGWWRIGRFMGKELGARIQDPGGGNLNCREKAQKAQKKGR